VLDIFTVSTRLCDCETKHKARGEYREPFYFSPRKRV
jgi:hypothetical protein